MDIDAPIKGMTVLNILPIQPQDSRYDRIPSWSIGWNNFPGRHPGLKYHSERETSSYLFANYESSQWGGIASWGITGSKTRGGNGIDCGNPTLSDECEFLIFHADDDFLNLTLAGGLSSSGLSGNNGYEAPEQK
jgi:hypothetical protein